jgi:hypothetical protein
VFLPFLVDHFPAAVEEIQSIFGERLPVLAEKPVQRLNGSLDALAAGGLVDALDARPRIFLKVG